MMSGSGSSVFGVVSDEADHGRRVLGAVAGTVGRLVGHVGIEAFSNTTTF
jgi:4-diphosphocytidyl-2C-methyl-D-erythritol kinase